MDRWQILTAFLAVLVLISAMARIARVILKGASDDDVPAVPVRPLHSPRSLSALHTRANIVALRGVRAHNERVEHLADKLARRKVEHWLLGTPPADRVAADRVTRTEREIGQEFVSILKEMRAPDHLIAIAEHVAADRVGPEEAA